MRLQDDQSFTPPQGIHVVAKPTGPACNLACTYCFYMEKQALYGRNRNYRMSDEVLTAFIKNYVDAQPTPAVEFVWQGGEPTLLGMDFFQRVIELQQPYMSKKIITNALQTNGTLLDDTWCRFLKKHQFMVGLSMDGPKDIHDRYRRDRNGKGAFDKTLSGLRLLQKHGVDFNIMASVSREAVQQAQEVYHFFKQEGVEFIQFAPIVERFPGPAEHRLGLNLAGPASINSNDGNTEVTPWTVLPEEYGNFLIAIYEEWVRNDVGTTFVMNFEWVLNAWIGNPSPVCVHSRQCGRAVVIEHNGDLFACDHYVYPQYHLGNILTTSLSDMVEASQQTCFGIYKEKGLTQSCLECEVLPACQGGCPKHRFAISAYNEPGQHYLCPGYKKFFTHIRKYLHAMSTLLENGYPASAIMEAIKGPLVLQPR